MNTPFNVQIISNNLSGIKVGWQANPTTEVGYRVFRTTDPTYKYFAQITFEPVNKREFLDKTVVSGKTYLYKVNAYNFSGQSAFSNQAVATANGGNPYSNLATMTQLSAPTNLQVTDVTTNSISLSWQSTSSGAEAGFIVERSDFNSGNFRYVGETNKNITTFNDTSGLIPNSLYYYRTSAII